MAYFKINNIDFSMYVNDLKIATNHIYKEMTTAAGNTLVKYVTSKRVLSVGIIPLDANAAKSFLTEVGKFNVNITFLNPKKNELETIAAIIPQEAVEYYTINANGTKLKAFTINIQEL